MVPAALPTKMPDGVKQVRVYNVQVLLDVMVLV